MFLSLIPLLISGATLLPTERLARDAFGADAPWYERDIPFFECSDPQIQKIYYYRWGLYKAHIRDVRLVELTATVR